MARLENSISAEYQNTALQSIFTAHFIARCSKSQISCRPETIPKRYVFSTLPAPFKARLTPSPTPSWRWIDEFSFDPRLEKLPLNK